MDFFSLHQECYGNRFYGIVNLCIDVTHLMINSSFEFSNCDIMKWDTKKKLEIARAFRVHLCTSHESEFLPYFK